MGMSVNKTGIWKVLSEANLRLYQYNMERGRTILQGAAAQEMQRELARIDSVYDGKKEASYETQINALYEKKAALADTGASLTQAISRLQEMRLTLNQMSSAAFSGKTELFDENLKDLNYLAGSSTGTESNLSNLIGNRNRGTWTSTIGLVSANGMDIQLKSQFMGTDYQIALDDGQTLSFDPSAKTVGSYKFDDLKLAPPSEASSITDGSKIHFTTGEKDENDVLKVFTGTLKMGGLDIGSAWMYGLQETNTFSKKIAALEKEISTLQTKDATGNADLIAENQTALDLEKAKLADAQEKNKTGGKILAALVNQTVKELDKVVREYEFANDMVKSATSNFDTTMKDIQRKYDDAAAESLNARTAARTALQAKMKLVDTKFALASTTSSVLISGLFSYTDTTEKKSLFDVLGTNQYDAYKKLMGS